MTRGRLTGGLTFWPGLVLLALLLLPLLMLLKANRQTEMTSISRYAKIVYDLLLKYGFRPDIAALITAQSAHETGNWTSSIFKNNNNLFGMKYIGQPQAYGEKSGHAYYESLDKSIEDYKRLWDLRNYPSFFATVQKFVMTLKRNNYFEAPESEYLKGVDYFYKLYFPKDQA